LIIKDQKEASRREWERLVRQGIRVHQLAKRRLRVEGGEALMLRLPSSAPGI
jgi:hypothetical protein